MTSGRGSSSNVASMVIPSMPFSLRTSPRWCPTNVTSNEGMRCNTSYGPMASRAVNFGNNATAICNASPVAASVGTLQMILVAR